MEVKNRKGLGTGKRILFFSIGIICLGMLSACGDERIINNVTENTAATAVSEQAVCVTEEKQENEKLRKENKQLKKENKQLKKELDEINNPEMFVSYDAYNTDYGFEEYVKDGVKVYPSANKAFESAELFSNDVESDAGYTIYFSVVSEEKIESVSYGFRGETEHPKISRKGNVSSFTVGYLAGYFGSDSIIVSIKTKKETYYVAFEAYNE